MVFGNVFVYNCLSRTYNILLQTFYPKTEKKKNRSSPEMFDIKYLAEVNMELPTRLDLADCCVEYL